MVLQKLENFTNKDIIKEEWPKSNQFIRWYYEKFGSSETFDKISSWRIYQKTQNYRELNQLWNNWQMKKWQWFHVIFYYFNTLD